MLTCQAAKQSGMESFTQPSFVTTRADVGYDTSMHMLSAELPVAVDVSIAAIRRVLDGAAAPILVALDGGSGSGKSTLAQYIAQSVASTVIASDDFFAAHISDAEWDARTPAARAADAIDWRRLRAQALEPLLAGHTARWQTFDFAAGTRVDGTYPMRTDVVACTPAAVVLLDGLFSNRPELSDLIDLSVLVDVPIAVRHARLVAREDAAFLAAWHARWDAAEAYYLTHVRPKTAFNLVVTL